MTTRTRTDAGGGWRPGRQQLARPNRRSVVTTSVLQPIHQRDVRARELSAPLVVSVPLVAVTAGAAAATFFVPGVLRGTAVMNGSARGTSRGANAAGPGPGTGRLHRRGGHAQHRRLAPRCGPGNHRRRGSDLDGRCWADHQPAVRVRPGGVATAAGD